MWTNPTVLGVAAGVVAGCAVHLTIGAKFVPQKDVEIIKFTGAVIVPWWALGRFSWGEEPGALWAGFGIGYLVGQWIGDLVRNFGSGGGGGGGGRGDDGPPAPTGPGPSGLRAQPDGVLTFEDFLTQTEASPAPAEPKTPARR